MVQITSFAWKAEGRGVSILCVEVFLLVCNVFYRWLLTDKPTAVLPYYITVTVWPEIFVSKPRIVLLPAALIFQVPLCPLSKWLLWSCYGDGGFCLCCCVYYSWLFRFGFFLRVYSASMGPACQIQCTYAHRPSPMAARVLVCCRTGPQRICMPPPGRRCWRRNSPPRNEPLKLLRFTLLLILDVAVEGRCHLLSFSVGWRTCGDSLC